MKKRGLAIKDIELFELNEAFASQSLYCIRELELPADRVNINGGAIALGHPIAATGARLILTAALQLALKNGKFALVTACVGGGQGFAIVLRRS